MSFLVAAPLMAAMAAASASALLRIQEYGHERAAGEWPERTWLAWRRSGAGIGRGGVRALPKVVFGMIGWWSLPATTLALLSGALILTVGHRRYVRTHRTLTGSGQLTVDGRPLFMIAVVVAASGITAVGALFAWQ